MKDDQATSIDKQNADASRASTSRFVISVGVIFAVLAIKTLGGTIANFGALRLSDPIFGVEIRYLLLVVTVVELFVASVCFVGVAPGSSGGSDRRHTAGGGYSIALAVAACLIVNFIFYCGTVWFMGYSRPWILLTSLSDVWGISPAIANILILITALYILTGSVGLLFFNRTKTGELAG